ncbi:MAG: GlsB/YeaQ/YmgE family stress response membrane protein [Methylotenera sp.]|nr:GlsB/YeaQ/YmgE family stress response membrane protein [Oligoflexia bacterium]
MNILGWILFGFVVGLIARALMPGRDPMGLVGTTALGVVGALLGGWIGQAAGWYGPEDGAGFLAATVGAMVVLAIYNTVARRRRALGTAASRDSPRKAA